MGYSPWGCKESDTTERLGAQHRKNQDSESFWVGEHMQIWGQC